LNPRAPPPPDLLSRIFLAFLLCASARAAVTRIDLAFRGSVKNGFPAEVTYGKVYFAADPKLAANRMICDIDLASKNAQGLVEFSADFYMLRPRNANGTALVEVSNRGGKGLTSVFDFAKHGGDLISAEALGDSFLLEQGFTLVWLGWEFDVPDEPGVLRANLPVATNLGKTISGMIHSEWVGEKRADAISTGDKAEIGYAALDPTSSKNQLFVRDEVAAPRTVIPHGDWQFVDDNHVKLKGGFAPGRLYDIVYEAKNPVVAGLGLAGLRDFVSYLKYGGLATPISAERAAIKWAIGFGVSQSGRLLREFLYDGFNQSEARQQVFDGIWAHVGGAGRGSFNQRFAQPSRDGQPFVNVFYPVDVPPFDERRLTERAKDAHVLPKLFLSHGSYEYWGRCASLIHTTADGRADVEPSANTRIYFFAGSQHGAGSIPPARVPAQNRANANDYRFGQRALLLALDKWIKAGAEPPPSRFPHLAKNELTSLDGLRFPEISGVAPPLHKREAYRLDFSAEPPKVGAPFPTFVPQVDADGNDVGGIQMPEVKVPLASYTGWNRRDAAIGAPTEMLSYTGSWIPFPLTKEERLKSGDPRKSVEERYSSRRAYLDKIDQAAHALLDSGFVLESDLPLLHERAAREWDFIHSAELPSDSTAPRAAPVAARK
jgi:hypothetical protein